MIDDLLCLAIILVLGCIVALAYFTRLFRQAVREVHTVSIEAPAPREPVIVPPAQPIVLNMKLGSDGEMIPQEDGVYAGSPLLYTGTGSFATPDLVIEHGWYGVRWDFPPQTTFSLRLMNTQPYGEDLLIHQASGRGQKRFHVIHSGRYVLLVDPLEGDSPAQWRVQIGRFMDQPHLS